MVDRAGCIASGNSRAPSMTNSIVRSWRRVAISAVRSALEVKGLSDSDRKSFSRTADASTRIARGQESRRRESRDEASDQGQIPLPDRPGWSSATAP